MKIESLRVNTAPHGKGTLSCDTCFGRLSRLGNILLPVIGVIRQIGSEIDPNFASVTKRQNMSHYGTHTRARIKQITMKKCFVVNLDLSFQCCEREACEKVIVIIEITFIDISERQDVPSTH